MLRLALLFAFLLGGCRAEPLPPDPPTEAWWLPFVTQHEALRLDTLRAIHAERQQTMARMTAKTSTIPHNPLPFEAADILSEHHLADPAYAVAVLQHTRMFASRHIGSDGVRSIQTLALDAVLAREDAERVLIDLAQRAAPAGQLYALAGLHALGSTHFDALRRPLLQSSITTYTFYGSNIMRDSVATLAVDIADSLNVAYWVARPDDAP